MSQPTQADRRGLRVVAVSTAIVLAPAGLYLAPRRLAPSGA